MKEHKCISEISRSFFNPNIHFALVMMRNTSPVNPSETLKLVLNQRGQKGSERHKVPCSEGTCVVLREPVLHPVQ